MDRVFRGGVGRGRLGLGGLVARAARLVVVLVALAGLATPARATAFWPIAGNYTITILFGGALRSFVLHLPTGFTTVGQYPVVIVESGYASTGSAIAAVSGFNAIADQNAFIVAYPNQVNGNWVLTGPNNDVQFTEAVLGWIATKVSVQMNHTYIVGYAQGGRLAMTYACSQQPGTYVAAFGVVSNDMNTEDEAVCQAQVQPPTSFMYFHGTADPTSPYNGGPGPNGTVNLSSLATAQYWATNDGCPNQPQINNVPDELSNGQYVTDTDQVWSGCAGGVMVSFYTITGGGHTWPGSASVVGPVGPNGPISLDVNASQLMWGLFSLSTAPA